MGQEIVYCHRCQIRLTGADLDKGKAFQVADRVSCAACLPERDREALLAGLPKDRRPPPARPESPRAGSRKVSGPPSAKSALGLTVGIGAAALVFSLIIALSGGGRRPTSPPEPEAVAKPKPPAGPSRAEQIAKDLAALDLELRGPVDREDFKQALAHLQAAAARRRELEWAAGVEERAWRVREAAERGRPVPAAPEVEKPFQQGVDGLLVIEAEHFSKKIDRGEQAWTPQSVAGAVAMQVLPDRNSPIQNDYAPRSPQLDYAVRFARAGTHVVWIRGLGPNDAANSVHLGLDGVALPGLTAVYFSASSKWAWTKTRQDKGLAQLEVPSAGLHVLNLWMREDGAYVDRIVITPSDKFAPEKEGPPESPR